jgi:uncharacterized protein YcnI
MIASTPHCRTLVALLAGAAFSLLPSIADAHISIASGAGLAGTSQEIAFGIGHGCEGVDTYSVRIEFPKSVSSVRPVRGEFASMTVDTDSSGNVTAVTWKKADADVLPADLAYYKLKVRMKVPDAPFTTIYFPTHQTCKAGDGTLSTVDWIGTPETTPKDGTTVEPAPGLAIVPAHQRGWNKVTSPVAITDLATYFGDALIVWDGSAAYSANPTTVDLIHGTSGVTELTSVKANDELWVKY